MSKMPNKTKLEPVKTKKKDDIKNFIDNEINKFQLKNKIPISQNEEISNQNKSMKENMKKIKELNMQTKTEIKSDEAFKVSQSKFKGFKLSESNKDKINLNTTGINSLKENDISMNTTASKSKNPFVIKKFEDITNSDNLITKEIIDDLNSKVDKVRE
jgi:hypothetical protein